MPVLTKTELDERVDAGLEALNKAIIVTEKVNVSRAHLVKVVAEAGHAQFDATVATGRAQRCVRLCFDRRLTKKAATGGATPITWRPPG